ncbi:photosystem II manganese-stabilizing polypeptide [Pseudanabaenaceae cyanobacterium LEGE 13415]|nr:photosystem II manganese-stabilizing polypeptide [Pseudanabaenaceae cyanobacterium LEGE 13415]
MRYRAFIVTLLAFCLSVLTACSEPAQSAEGLTYEQIRGTGLANSCPQIEETSRGSIAIEPGKTYSITSMCLQPTTYFVKEETGNKRREAEFVPAKVMTRYTSSIDAVSGTLTANPDGSLTFVEEDGLDFQAITLQLPGGERVPFLFTIKSLVATTAPGSSSINTSTDFTGNFRVPSYRTSNFLDPKSRGLTTGYDNAIAFPSAADAAERRKENIKRFQLGQGTISLQVAKIDSASGEIAGTFESEQPSDSDMGSREPSDIKIRGLFYARIGPSA